MALGDPGPLASMPILPGVTSTAGPSSERPDPIQMMAMLMGNQPPKTDSTMEKMEQIVRLLREVSKSDPKIAMLTSEALRVLVDGGKSLLGSGPGTPQKPGAPSPGGSIPMGGPGGMSA